MNLPRVIPSLLLDDGRLVKTTRFGRPIYVGDPVNTVKIFNDKEVDELALLDISATPGRRGPAIALLQEIATEAFMPMAYGGGVTRLEQVRELLHLGFEKVIFGTSAFRDPDLVARTAAEFGSQAVVVAVDARPRLFRGSRVHIRCGREATAWTPEAYAKRMEEAGAGELLLTAIDREGTWGGYDAALIDRVAHAVSIPVIAHGGAGTLADLRVAAQHGAAAVAAGNLFTFQRTHRAVLISFPSRAELRATFA